MGNIASSEQAELFRSLLNTDEAAEQLKVHRVTILRWVRDGLMTPAHKSRGRTGAYIFTAEEVARARRNIRRRRHKAAA